ncbi:hypothetical protein RB195_025817 [Necator americanus]|uniref:Uncharacterized protein n=1 Tax=Necator americanus TaxID=51031 RepID=A0ABR1EUM1_NECAM
MESVESVISTKMDTRLVCATSRESLEASIVFTDAGTAGTGSELSMSDENLESYSTPTGSSLQLDSNRTSSRNRHTHRRLKRTSSASTTTTPPITMFSDVIEDYRLRPSTKSETIERYKIPSLNLFPLTFARVLFSFFWTKRKQSIQIEMILRTTVLLSLIFLLFITSEAAFSRDRFMVRKGGRLERLQKRTLYEWRNAHRQPRHRHHRHKRRRHERDGGMRIEHVLAQMDSFVRPRFGRSAGFLPVQT